MLFLIVNILVALIGLVSIAFGAIGVGVMNVFWRVLHVVIGILMVWCAAPYVLDRFLPRR